MVLLIYVINYQECDSFPMTGSIILLKAEEAYFNRGQIYFVYKACWPGHRHIDY
jgi:hypothetical protein